MSSFVHRFDEEEAIVESYMENFDFFCEKEYDLELLEHKLENNIMFSESTIDTNDVILEGVSDVLRTIGEKIIEIVEKCIKFIDEKIEKFNRFLWERKDKEKVLKQLKAQRPDIANKIDIAIANGNLKLNNFKDLSTFYKSIDDVLDEIEKADRKSVKGKLLKAKKILSDSADVIIKVGQVVGAVAGAYGLYAAINNNRRAAASDERSRIKHEWDRVKFDERNNTRRTVSYDANGRVKGYTIKTESVLLESTEQSYSTIKIDELIKAGPGQKDTELDKMRNLANQQGDKIKQCQKKIEKRAKALESTSVDKSTSKEVAEIREMEGILSDVANEYKTVTSEVINRRVKFRLDLMRAGDRAVNMIEKAGA